MKKLALLLLSACFLLTSCDNDLDVLEEYTEIPVIYGLINPASTTFEIRVQKAFLGAGNALLMAQETDSTYYNPNDISLYLEKLQFANSAPFDVDTFSVNYNSIKNEGLFTDAGHYVFQLANTRLNSNFIYRLRFVNNVTGKNVTGITRIIEPLYQKTLTPTTRVNLADDDPYTIRFNSSKNGKVYGLIMRIRYSETKKLTQAIVTKYLDFPLDYVTSRTLTGGEDMEFLINGKSVFQFLGLKIKKDTTVTRRLQDFKSDFLFTAATDDFYNYIQINNPNNTVNFIPDFTNLSEGKGLFTCRLDTLIPSISFNDLTYDSLLNGTYTRHIFE
ncbi:MAG: hypothetical protein IPJ86_00340 [Bacteroidetes bacterium]|nr:hypothetical protein [Bacteroidota bacterium]MBK9319889.1 hypothetical protein [Bacteroidota bacterium]